MNVLKTFSGTKICTDGGCPEECAEDGPDPHAGLL